MERAGVCFIGFRSDGPPQDEATIEARTHLMAFRAALREKGSVDAHQFMRDWISRRMDVVAIDQSLILATILAGIMALGFFRPFPSSVRLNVALGASTLLIMVMVCSIRVLRRQVVEVIRGD